MLGRETDPKKINRKRELRAVGLLPRGESWAPWLNKHEPPSFSQALSVTPYHLCLPQLCATLQQYSSSSPCPGLFLIFFQISYEGGSVLVNDRRRHCQ